MSGSSQECVVADKNVSRETLSRLSDFAKLVVKWNATINLISKATVDQIWSRHILDSVQVFDYGLQARRWVDLGSGGGFPGLVVAILAKERAPEMQVILVESDQRKAAFLRQASQSLGLDAQVVCDRIELVHPLDADAVSARALAPLPQLLAFAVRHLAKGGVAIVQKGQNHRAELTDARRDWQFRCDTHQSSTDPSAAVLVIKEIAHG